MRCLPCAYARSRRLCDLLQIMTVPSVRLVQQGNLVLEDRISTMYVTNAATAHASQHVAFAWPLKCCSMLARDMHALGITQVACLMSDCYACRGTVSSMKCSGTHDSCMHYKFCIAPFIAHCFAVHEERVTENLLTDSHAAADTSSFCQAHWECTMCARAPHTSTSSWPADFHGRSRTARCSASAEPTTCWGA